MYYYLNPIKHISLVIGCLFLCGCLHIDQKDSKFEVSIILIDQFGQSANTFTQGEVIRFELRLKNISPEPIQLQFGSPAISDFYIRDQSNITVWTDVGRPTVLIAVEFTLQPGEVLEGWGEDWNQRLSRDDSLIDLGDYIVEGQFVGMSVDGESIKNSRIVKTTLNII